MGLDSFRLELASGDGWERMYALALDVARTIVRVRRYPPTYSPQGVWNDEVIEDLAHDWITEKLLARNQLSHLLLMNETEAGLRKGLELSFADFVVGQRKRTELDHLFRRANVILESDPTFVCVVEADKKAVRVWGLAEWGTVVEASQVTDEQLLTAGFAIADVPVIRYREGSKKLSPVISDANLATFLRALLAGVGRPVSLEQVVFVCRYRFNLLEAGTVSLDEPTGGDNPDASRSIGESISRGPTPEEMVIGDHVARTILDEIPERQRSVLLAYAETDATLTSVGQHLGLSKSTVDNDLRRAMSLIRQRTETSGEAEQAYERILEILSTESLGFR